MANVHCCFYGNIVLAYFTKHYPNADLAPPTPEQYLSGA